MDYSISRSEQKRRVQGLEELAKELVALSKNDIARLPGDDQFFKQELLVGKEVHGGAYKRQLKYLCKLLRQCDPDPYLAFLAERKGSELKEATSFHELERLRDEIVSEAIAAQQEALRHDRRLTTDDFHSEMIEVACREFPTLDPAVVAKSAVRYAVTRKPSHNREIFRALKAAKDNLPRNEE